MKVASLRLSDQRGGEELAEIAIDVVDAVLRRNFREVADPFDAPGLLELRHAVVGFDRAVPPPV